MGRSRRVRGPDLGLDVADLVRPRRAHAGADGQGRGWLADRGAEPRRAPQQGARDHPRGFCGPGQARADPRRARAGPRSQRAARRRLRRREPRRRGGPRSEGPPRDHADGSLLQPRAAHAEHDGLEDPHLASGQPQLGQRADRRGPAALQLPRRRGDQHVWQRGRRVHWLCLRDGHGRGRLRGRRDRAGRPKGQGFGQQE